MNVLTLNAGLSSIEIALHRQDGTLRRRSRVERNVILVKVGPTTVRMIRTDEKPMIARSVVR
jgi:acetate kinase